MRGYLPPILIIDPSPYHDGTPDAAGLYSYRRQETRSSMRAFRSRAPSFAAAVLAAAALVPFGRQASAQPLKVPPPVESPQRERTGVSATNADIGRYEALYGTPEDLPLEDVIRMLQRGERFAHAVRTRGRFEDPGSGATPRSRPSYALCEGPRCLSPIRPVEEIAPAFEAESESFRARELEIVGAVESAGFLFWSYALPDPTEARPRGPGGGLTLEALVTQKAPFGNRDVTVRGQFRGRNLFGDLPAGSGVTPADWVISDGPFYAWVTGKPPRGSGFSLDPASRADCAFWLAVEGRPERHGEVVVLRARRIQFLGRSPVHASGPP